MAPAPASAPAAEIPPPTSDGIQERSAVETAPGASSAPLPDPWGRAKDIRSAVGGGHYAKGVAGGQKYTVKDARSGESVSVGIPLIVMDGEQPRAYPTSAHVGHVIFKSRSQGAEVLLDYALHWDPSASRADGSTGGFLVDGVVLIQRGRGVPAVRFVREGGWWRREVVAATGDEGTAAPTAGEGAPPPPG